MIRGPASKETARKPNMREAILAAAEELFSVDGFNAVWVRDVAHAAGANPGSVTCHFTTRDGLLLEIYRRHCAPSTLVTPERVSRLSRGETNGADPAEAIEQLVQATVASLQAPTLDRPTVARPPSKISASAGPLPR